MNTVIESQPDNPEYRRIFVDTFSNEPSFKYMLPNDDTRKSHVAWLVDKTIKLKGKYFYTLTTKDQIKGFAWWIPPGKSPSIGILQQLRIGYWKAPLKFGPSSFSKMFHFGEQEARILSPYLNAPHWILDVIAVDPTGQRSGLGGKLMKPVFEIADRDRIPCFVLTHNPRNVGFYQKYGFELVIQEPLKDSGVSAFGLLRKSK